MKLLPQNKRLAEIARGAVVALLFKALAVIFSFLFNVTIARMLGAEETGVFMLGLTVCMIAATVGRVGLDNTVVKFSAASAAGGEWQAVLSLYRRSVSLASVGSGSVALLIFLLSDWLAATAFQQPALGGLLKWMAVAIVPIALFNLHAQFLKGLKKIRAHVLVLSGFLPAFSLVGCLLLIPLLGLRGAVAGYLCGALATLFLATYLWRRALPAGITRGKAFPLGDLAKSAIPLFWVSVLQVVVRWAPVLMLGVFATGAEVGVFAMANQTAMLMSFLLFAVNSISAPNFAVLHREQKLAEMESVARNVNKILFLVVVPVLAIVLIFPEDIMGVFGTSFVPGSTALVILAVGQFINVAVGSVGFLLMMSGYEKVMRNILICSAVTSVVLNLLLIPLYGALGAAVATATTVALQNILAAVCVRKMLGIVVVPGFAAKFREV